jgi:CHAT domain-containing protein/Tfp pilus assembly protein PilF
MRRALNIEQKQPGPERHETAAFAIELAGIQLSQGHFADAESSLQQAVAIDERAVGADQWITALSNNQLAILLQAEGRYADAETLYRSELELRERKLGPDHPNTATSVSNLGALFLAEGRVADAEVFFRRALAIGEKSLSPDDLAIAGWATLLAGLLEREGPQHAAEAEALTRRALGIYEKKAGPQSPRTANSLVSLASALEDEARYGGAEPLLRRAPSIREATLGAEHPDTAESLDALGAFLVDRGRYAEADPLLMRAIAIEEKTLGAEHPNVATGRLNLAKSNAWESKWPDAVANFRAACPLLTAVSRQRDQSGAAALVARSEATDCWRRLTVSLAAWAAAGGGTAATDKKQALLLEAFVAAQRAEQSAAGEAMARSAALSAAKTAAVGPQAEAYEAALLSRDDLDKQFTKTEDSDADNGADKRKALEKARLTLNTKIDALAADLKTKAPLYWDYRAPEPVAAGALQSKSGVDAVLLREDEALITFLVLPDKGTGLVFAVSKESIAWSTLGMTGEEITSRVSKLRSEIDPEGYAVPGTAPNADDAGGAFNRQSAYELYRALLGSAAIQSVIKDKPILLFVPSGPLTTLPPGLLVTQPPQGGRDGDKDPDTLRATPWLLRSKAVALLPSVSSLRTLREILPAARKMASDPLLVFADPDFSKVALAQKHKPASVAARGFASYFRDGVPIADALQDVPTLPGTRIEGEALEKALNGKPGSLLLGREASKAQLMQRNKDGRLAQVRVLEFATHGLAAGFASDLAEPALLLAAGDKPSDELLLASEAATLNLNADWVLLSACNTASPDEPEAQGLSGLSRAFFFAGARSLLVSHWRVRDDVAPVLIPAMLLAERQNPGMSRAQALQQATLAVLDNRALDAAAPAAWDTFYAHWRGGALTARCRIHVREHRAARCCICPGHLETLPS